MVTRGGRARSQVLVAALLAAPLPFGATIGLAAGPPGGGGAPGRTYSFANLPPDPAKAAIALVDTILGKDAEAANAATIELLRRSGMPVVSAKGPVVALPDDYVLVDAAIYSEFIPFLTTSVRRGDGLSPDQFAGYMNDLGAFPGELPPDVLMAGLGTWGKDKDSGPEERTAAAAIRALSAHRGEVLFAEADPETVHLDMLQLELVLGTLSFVGRVEPANPEGLKEPPRTRARQLPPSRSLSAFGTRQRPPRAPANGWRRPSRARTSPATTLPGRSRRRARRRRPASSSPSGGRATPPAASSECSTRPTRSRRARGPTTCGRTAPRS